MKIILVTGGSGLVGKAIQNITKNDDKNKWIFLSSKDCIYCPMMKHSIFSSSSQH